MSYCTKADMIARFGELELIQLTDDVNAGAIDDETLAQAIADAEAEINSYLAGRYTVPLPSTPLVLVRIATDIARYYLYADRVTEQVRVRYDDGVKFLRAVAKGDVSIGVDSLNAPAAVNGGPQFNAGTTVFNHDSLSDY